jgi:protein-tyrosine-phosphatase
LDLTGATPVHVRDVVRDDDLVITVCDVANEHLPPAAKRVHWSVPDPARLDTDAAFEATYVNLSDRIDRLVPVMSGGVA